MNDLFMIENSLAIEGGVPKQLRILPLGLLKSQKGDFLVDNESFTSIRQDFKQRQLQIPIDYEHQTLHDVQAPAAGWIKEISLKQDGIYGAVEWTPKATDCLANKEYKYCSPVIIAHGSDHKAVKLHSVALTNKPAIDAMIPIVNSDKPNEVATDPAATPSALVDLGVLATLLQLPASATLNDIYGAVSALMNSQTTLKLKVDAMEFEAYKLKVDGAVFVALKEGKLMPWQKDWAYRNAMNDIDDFMIWYKGAPQVVPMGQLTYPSQTVRREVSRRDELLGLLRDDVREFGRNPANAL